MRSDATNPMISSGPIFVQKPFLLGFSFRKNFTLLFLIIAWRDFAFQNGLRYYRNFVIKFDLEESTFYCLYLNFGRIFRARSFV